MKRCLTSYIVREMQQWVWHYACYCCLITQSCATLCHPVARRLPGSSVHAISQARTLEGAVISFLRGSSQPKDRTCISCIGRQFLYHRATREAKIFTIWSSRKIFCWSLFCSIIVVIIKVLDSSTHIFYEDMNKDYWVLYAVSSHELVWFLVFDLFYNSVSCRKLILMQIALNCRKANKLCWVECSWFLPYEYGAVLFPCLSLFVNSLQHSWLPMKLQYFEFSFKLVIISYLFPLGFLVAQLVKHPPAMWETWVLSLGWEDSHGEGKVYPLWYSGLENSIDCIVHGVAKSWTQLSDFHFHFSDMINIESLVGICFTFVWVMSFSFIKKCALQNLYIKHIVAIQSLGLVQLFGTLRTVARHASLSSTIFHSLLRFMSIESVMPSNHLILCCPFSSCLQSFPASGPFAVSWLFASGDQSTGVQLQHQSFQCTFSLWDWPLWSLFSPKDSQESFPVSQFEGISSSVLSLVCGPTVTSVHDYQQNHSFD